MDHIQIKYDHKNQTTEYDEEVEQYIVDGETAVAIRTAITYAEGIDKKNLKKYKAKLKKAQADEDKRKQNEMDINTEGRLDMYEDILVKFDQKNFSI